MTRSDYGSSNVLTVGIADSNPTVIRSLTVELALNVLASQKVNHPAFSVLTGTSTKLRCVHSV
ncbi:hypothetical protein NBRC116589_13700 [Ruegeria sp. HU-ET01832]